MRSSVDSKTRLWLPLDTTPASTEPSAMSLVDHPAVDLAFLEAHGFDADRFETEARAVGEGRLTPEASTFRGVIEPHDAVVPVDFADTEARSLGEAALRRGELAIVVLNGGMATRFGGVVKGVVEVVEGRSFLSLKAEDAVRAGRRFGAPVPVVLMNSFATAETTREHLEDHHRFGLRSEDLFTFEQTISIRLNPDGSLFIDDEGKVGYYAPGHGDFFPCIRRSGVLKALRARGVQHVLFSNVDNVGATIDPIVFGHHLRAGSTMTVEVTEKRRNAEGKWDKGGAPARVDGRALIVEGFRFPPTFPQETLPDFSTNTMYFSVKALSHDFELPRHVVKKTVDSRTALQLESIACEASAAEFEGGVSIFQLGLLRVPRDGPRGRFFPVKEPHDLEAQRIELVRRMETGWSHRDADPS